MILKSAYSSCPFTYLITPGALTPENYAKGSDLLLQTIDTVSRLGISAVQLREKKIPARLVFDLALRTRKILVGRETFCLVNERFDIAVAAGVDGVHLTSASIPVSVVRRHCPKGFLIGISTHAIKEVAQARDNAADLAVFGPVFSTPGKPSPEAGERLGDLRNASSAAGEMLLLGLGGIDENNIASVLESGADGAAAIRLFNDVERAEAALRSLK